MKPKEFAEIKKRFEQDQSRWESLSVGDVIYDEQARGGWDMDYHKMIIDSINIEERSYPIIKFFKNCGVWSNNLYGRGKKWKSKNGYSNNKTEKFK